MKESTIIIIIMMIIFIYFIKYCSAGKDISYIKSNMNEKFYMVRNLPDKLTAVNTIARLVNDLKILINKCHQDLKLEKKDENKMKLYINRMYSRFNDIAFRESSADSPYTSYTVNKGDEMVLCLRSKKTGKIHDYNILLYVAIHELAHVGCTEIGHTPLFFEINRYLLRKAIRLGLYKYEDYKIYEKTYCGMKVNNNVLG
jgi:hypothetical protein